MTDTTSTPAPELRSYLIGFVLAIVLTAIPFGIVAFDLLPRLSSLVVIAIAAVIQVLVHLRFFLHMRLHQTPLENLLVMAFAVFLIFIMVGGSLWIMFDLFYRMQL
ncbi:cytochrome o ubiquinol oxidase subunit IV [Bauldia sp.]|uniref:cytochrome o ubiquinol oxidase subunit IV n=1 Tax=Bauldia sp. TaxID=2575872 RepID=UPI003BA95857